MIGYLVAALLLLIAGFVWWRYTSVARGARRRDDVLLARLDGLASRFVEGGVPSAEEIAEAASRPELRPMLHRMLWYYSRQDLFPGECLSVVAQGEALLAYWLMHPNEMGGVPSAIEFVSEIERAIGRQTARYLVFRFREPGERSTDGDGWLLGVVGPFLEDEAPYRGGATPFSGFEPEGNKTPEELVDWYIRLRSKVAG